MKKIIIFLLIIALLRSCSQTSTDKLNAQTTISQNNNEIIKELTIFYTKYFSEVENMSKISEKNLDVLRQKYMSSKLYEKLKNINLDYDPVINGQDIDPNWKNTLSIKYIKEGNLYEVYTINSFDNSKNYTYLKVEKSKNGYKIYDIKVNDISSILSYLNDGEENGNRIEKTNTEYSADGTWKTNCDKGLGSITIEGKSASLVLLYNQIYIELTEVKRYDFEKGISYKLKEIPEDLGSLGIHLNWKEYLNDEPIAYLKKIDDNTINFYWYGFYNKKTKKREFKDNSFYQETEIENIVLKKCED